jgi:hypothetical protein
VLVDGTKYLDIDLDLKGTSEKKTTAVDRLYVSISAG